MDCEAFRNSPVGRLEPISGRDEYLKRDFKHFAFIPSPLPADLTFTMRSHSLMADAARAIGRLDAAADLLPDASILIRPTLYREAVSTSALEGTYAPFHEVLESDLVEDEAKLSREVREIRNYYLAALRGIELLKTKPICVTVLRELQAILVRGTRGESCDSGQLRARQVFIGERRTGIEASRFVPPPGGDVLVEGMSDWEKWVNAIDDFPLLLKVAVAHYQFEALHPFFDGNGRLGRLVMLLQLMDAKALRYPILDISAYIEPKKEEYKDLLLDISRTGEFDPWVQFFAEAVTAQADDGVARIKELDSLRETWIQELRARKARGVVLELIDDLISYPYITASLAADLHNVTYPPALAAIGKLVDMGVLREITGRDYRRTYACDAVLNVLDRPNNLTANESETE